MLGMASNGLRSTVDERQMLHSCCAATLLSAGAGNVPRRSHKIIRKAAYAEVTLLKERADIINLEDVCDVEAGMSPALFQYYTGLSKRRIILNDQIDDGIVERVILPLIDMDNDGTGEPIEIILSSPGGSLYDGFVLADIIDRLKTPTTIIVMGYAFSMGSIILMSGYSNPNVRKVCYPSSTALIHSGSTYLEGTANTVKDTFQFNQRMEERVKRYILNHSHMTEQEYEKMERYEWYLLSEDMLRLGLVDEVL